MMHNTCMKFYEHFLNGFKVIERIRFCHRNCYLQSSKGCNSKSINTRVTVMVLALGMSSNVGFKVIERIRFCHRNCYLQSSKGCNSKSINTRVTVMVLALGMSSNVG